MHKGKPAAYGRSPAASNPPHPKAGMYSRSKAPKGKSPSKTPKGASGSISKKGKIAGTKARTAGQGFHK